MNLVNEEFRLIGTVVQDAKIVDSTNGQAIVYAIAINHSYKNKSGEIVKYTNFYETAKWYPKGKNIQTITELITKGSTVALVGQPKPRAFVKENGEIVSSISVTVDDFRIVKYGKERPGSGPEETIKDIEDFETEDFSPEMGDDVPF